VDPLSAMGAAIEARDGEYPPLRIRGTRLRGIRYVLPVASAQVKSCVLIAGLTAEGRTTVVEPTPTRDHTERALPHFGVAVGAEAGSIWVEGPCDLHGIDVTAPGDLSAAVFFLVAAQLLPGSQLTLPAVGVNPSRSVILDLLEQARVPVVRQNPRLEGGEPVCDLVVESGSARLEHFPTQISGDTVAGLIDEIPALAVLGTRLPGGITIRDAAELRKKESDRIRSVVENLRAVGVDAKEFPDGLAVPYTPRIRGGRIRTWGDHRIAMAFAVLGLVSEEGVELDDPDCAAVSFPEFYRNLAGVTG
jgi:3-phosphoshikimate 1-carboxyvinyltransferase